MRRIAVKVNMANTKIVSIDYNISGFNFSIMSELMIIVNVQVRIKMLGRFNGREDIKYLVPQRQFGAPLLSDSFSF